MFQSEDILCRVGGYLCNIENIILLAIYILLEINFIRRILEWA